MALCYVEQNKRIADRDRSLAPPYYHRQRVWLFACEILLTGFRKLARWYLGPLEIIFIESSYSCKLSLYNEILFFSFVSNQNLCKFCLLYVLVWSKWNIELWHMSMSPHGRVLNPQRGCDPQFENHCIKVRTGKMPWTTQFCPKGNSVKILGLVQDRPLSVLHPGHSFIQEDSVKDSHISLLSLYFLLLSCILDHKHHYPAAHSGTCNMQTFSLVTFNSSQ